MLDQKSRPEKYLFLVFYLKFGAESVLMDPHLKYFYLVKIFPAKNRGRKIIFKIFSFLKFAVESDTNFFKTKLFAR